MPIIPEHSDEGPTIRRNDLMLRLMKEEIDVKLRDYMVRCAGICIMVECE